MNQDRRQEGQKREGQPFGLGDWTVHPDECVVRRGGEERHLFPQQMDVLTYLARNQGRVVPKEEILDAIWQDTVVQEVALPRCVSAIRKALGDKADDPRFLKTVPKRGYQMIAPVTWGPAERQPSSRPSRLSIAAILVVLVIPAALSYAWWRSRSQPAPGVEALLDSDRMATPLRSSVKTGPRVVVLQFRGLSDDETHDWLATGLQELLANELALSRGLQVVPTELVSQVVRQLSIPADLGQLNESFRQVHSSLGAAFAVAGTYLVSESEAGPRLRVDIQLWDLNELAVLSSWTEVGEEPEALELAALMGAHLRQALGEGEPAARGAGSLAAYLPKEPTTLRLYFAGLGKLRELDPMGARELLERALARDPHQPFGELALAEAWAALGHEANARAAAERSLALAAELPREQNLWVVASYLATTQQWEEAIERFRALWLFSPENLEYPLLLANAQILKGSPAAALSTLDALRRGAETPHSDPRIDLVAARAAAGLGEYDRALESAQTALDWAVERSAELVAANARQVQAQALHELGEVEAARTTLQEARLSFISAGDRRSEAKADLILAEWMRQAGDFEAARAGLESSLATFRQLGDRANEAAALIQLGEVLGRAGEVARAEESLQAAISICRETGNRLGEARALHGFGDLMGMVARMAEAEEALSQALVIAREVGHRELTAVMLMNLGKVDMIKGDATRGTSRLEESARVFEELGREFRAARTQCFLGRAQVINGDLAKAEAAYRRAVELATPIRSTRVQTCGLNGLGLVALWRGELPQARATLEEALELGIKMGNPPAMVTSRLHLATLTLAEGEHLEAAEQAREALVDALKLQFAVSNLREVLIWALLGLGEIQQAEQVLADERARQIPEQYQEIEIVSFRVEAAATRRISEPERLAEYANTNSYWLNQMKAQLAQGEIALLYGDAAEGQRLLSDLERDARQRGCGLMAAWARDLLAGRGRPGAGSPTSAPS